MNVCHLNTQFGADTHNGANTSDWFDSRTGATLEFPDLDLDIELHTKPPDSSGELCLYNEHELGVACLGAEGDWLTKPIVLPCGRNEQRSDYSFQVYKDEFPTPTSEPAVDYASASPESITRCYTDSFELNDDVISSILGTDETYQQFPSEMLTSWHPVTADSEVVLPPHVVGGSGDLDAGKVVARSRKRDLEMSDDIEGNVPAAKNRKKEQNKSAALKYRQKKRDEQSKLEDRRDKLEEENQKLLCDIASLESEIAYLKQLWQDLHGKLA